MTPDDNPYKPPKAEPRDSGRVRLIAERPQQIVQATALLWISFALGMPAAYADAQRDPETAVASMVLVGVVLAVGVVMSVSVMRGRNWARVLYLVLVVMSLMAFPSALEQSGRPVVLIGMEAVSFVADAGSLFLLFTKPGSLWFQYVRERGAS